MSLLLLLLPTVWLCNSPLLKQHHSKWNRGWYLWSKRERTRKNIQGRDGCKWRRFSLCGYSRQNCKGWSGYIEGQAQMLRLLFQRKQNSIPKKSTRNALSPSPKKSDSIPLSWQFDLLVGKVEEVGIQFLWILAWRSFGIGGEQVTKFVSKPRRNVLFL